jgi:putative MATE family efflux protein
VSRTKNMTAGKPAKLMMSFAIPLIIANLGQQLYMIVDTIIVGKGVGVEALAAVGAADWSYWLALWVIQAMTQGFAISISHSFGEGNQGRIKTTVAMSIWLCALIGSIMTVICLSIGKALLRLLQTPEAIFGNASAYLLTMYSGILVVMAYNMAAAILRAFGDSKTPLVAIAIAGVANIVLDLLFVLRLHWGVVGAAVATVLAQFLAFLYCMLVFRKMDLVKMSREDWKPNWNIIRNQCRLGFPPALQHVLISTGGMILQSAINQQGFVFIAGFTATNKIYGLLESSAVSLGFAATTYTAQNYGAGLYERIREGLKSSVRIAILMSVCISVVMIGVGRYLLELFIDQTNANAQDVLQIAYQYLFIMSCLLWFLYLLYAFRNTLQGLGNTSAAFASGVLEFLARVSVALIFSRIWGAKAIFCAEPCAWIAATILLAVVCIRKVKALPRNSNRHSG